MRTVLLLIFAAAMFSPANAKQDSAAVARLDAIEARLSLNVEGEFPRYTQGEMIVRSNLLEQSGSIVHGGWIQSEIEREFVLDNATRSLRFSDKMGAPAVPEFGAFTMTIVAKKDAVAFLAGDQWRPAGAFQQFRAARVEEMFPPLLLAQARRADDLAVAKNGNLTFTRGQEEVELLLSENGRLLKGFEIRAAYPENMFLAPWGRSVLHGEYSFWWQSEEGVLMPRQLDLKLNGLPWMRTEVTASEFPESVDQSVFDIPEDLGEAAVRSMDDFPFSTRSEEIAPGVRTYYGAWNVTVVEIKDGLLVLEAPISPGYSRRVLEAIEKDFPGRAVKAVFSSSAAWPHIAGVRAYAEKGLQVYAIERNRPILEAFLGPAMKKVRFVKDGFDLDPGPGRIVVRQSPGPETLDMAYLSLEDYGLSYASDAVQLDQEGNISGHARQYVSEFLEATCPDHSDRAERVIAMHIDVMDVAALASQFAAGERFGCDVQ